MKFRMGPVIALCFFPLLTHANVPYEKVIYGKDNRVDVCASKNSKYRRLSRSTAAQIPTSNIVLSDQDGKARIQGKSLLEMGVCEEERFSGQIAAARCSGFLVGPDLLVTAGHCVRTQWDCSEYSWVFDYKERDANFEEGLMLEFQVPAKSVYGCKEIISGVVDDQTMNDYALVRLDRKVEDRKPLKYRKKGKIRQGAGLVVIGHPSGLPTKIADGARVRTNDNKFYFVANLDTYGGNSGSAVMDYRTGVVEGILVRGEADYDYHPEHFCRISKKCKNDECRGEDVTRITNISELMTH